MVFYVINYIVSESRQRMEDMQKLEFLLRITGFLLENRLIPSEVNLFSEELQKDLKVR